MAEPLGDHDVTKLLPQWRRGDQAALERLIPIVYQELHRVASARLRGEGRTTRCKPRRSSTRRTCGWSASTA
jgi:hypothetical protein